MLSELSVRHRGDLRGSFTDLRIPAKVTISATEEVLRTPNAQHLIWMLVNLLARQRHEIKYIELNIPHGIKVEGNLSPLVSEGGDFLEAIKSGVMKIHEEVLSPTPTVSTVSIRIGPGDLGEADFALTATSSGWCSYVGQIPTEIMGERFNPIGAYIAACLASGEVFKFVRGMRPGVGDFAEKLWFDSYNLSLVDKPSGAPDLPEFGRLRPAVLVGVGAVGNSFLHVLYSLSNFSSDFLLIDGDKKGLEGSNLNRYTMFGIKHIGHQKASAAAAAFAGTRHNMRPIDDQWSVWRSKNRQYPLGLVVSAVDKNIARHSIQDELPDLIIGGSTNEMRAQINLYDVANGGQCLRCRNEPEHNTSDEEVIQQLQRLRTTDLEQQATKLGVTLEDLSMFLKDPVKHCGVISGDTLRQFSVDTEGETDWSVGFVSALSGVLLAAEYIKLSLWGQPALTATSSQFRFQFWRPNAARFNRIVTVHPAQNCICQTSLFQRALRLKHATV